MSNNLFEKKTILTVKNKLGAFDEIFGENISFGFGGFRLRKRYVKYTIHPCINFKVNKLPH